MEESVKLEQLVFVEFLEFIGRVASLVFVKNETMNLYDKIYHILQKLFEVIGEEVKEPTWEYVVESESDDELF